MRYIPAKHRRAVGEYRTIKKFLLIPRKIGHEWRWLEKAEIKQQLQIHYGLLWQWFDINQRKWKDKEWINK